MSGPMKSAMWVTVVFGLMAGSRLCLAADKLHSPLSPQEALKAFQLDPGLRIELVAAEPQVVDPVAMAFDERGRLYVVEMRDYPANPGKPIGRVALLEDKDNDGYYETRHEFAEGLISPQGVACWDGGVFVTSAPDVFYFKDTDGDNKADVKKTMFTGFDLGGSSQLRVNHPTFGIDNWFYLANGLSGGDVASPEYPKHPKVRLGQNDFRFKPGTDQFEAIGGFAQFGLSFDDYGHRFICMNREHCNQVVLNPAYLERNPNLPFTTTYQDISDHGAACRIYPISHAVTTFAMHAGTFTAACSVTVYRGTALPPEYRGNSLTCDPTGNLVHRDQLKPGGAAMVASRVDEKMEFVRSPDDWFRPVFLANAPDGAFYICDMYRKTIEHPVYLPEEIRKISDFESGKDKGRIWRVIAADARPQRKPFDLTRESDEDLIRHLASPDGWQRDTAQRLLLERHPSSVSDFVRVVLTEDGPPPSHAQALWTLDALGALDDSDILRGLDDGAPGVRENAVRLAESRLTRCTDLREKTLAMASDPDARVRFQVALSLGAVNDEQIIAPLVSIALRDLGDRFTRAAVISSCGGFSGRLMQAFVGALSKHSNGGPSATLEESSKGLLDMIRLLSTTVGAAESIETCGSILAHIATSPGSAAAWKMSAIRGLLEGLARAKKPATLAKLMAEAEKQSAGTAPALRGLILAAQDLAASTEAVRAMRLEAIGLLTYVEQSSERLQKLISPEEPADIQLAALRALLQQADDKTLAALLDGEHWPGFSPPVRAGILGAMLSRPRQLSAILSSMEGGVVPPLALTPAQREALMKNKDATVSDRAKKLFSELGSSDRRKAYQESLEVLKLPADPRRGQAVFTRLCAQCHQLEGQGVPVGPDLTGVRNQSPETLLMHIVIPEAEILPGYQNHIVETNEGEIYTGLLLAQTPTSVTLRKNLGQEETILRSSIASMYVDSLSLMPQELEKNMTRQELADLIALLRNPEAGVPTKNATSVPSQSTKDLKR